MEGAQKEAINSVQVFGRKDAGMSIEEIVQGICSQDAHQQLIAAQNARDILSREPCPPIDTMIASGVVPMLVHILKCHDNVPLQFEACWALALITSGNFTQRKVVVEAGAVPNFTGLLSSPHVNVAEKAVWALGNIASDGVYLRELVIRNNIIPPLQALLTPNTSLQLLRNITGILLKISINEIPPPPFDVIQIILPTLADLINHSDQEVLNDSLYAISYLSEVSDREFLEVLGVGVVPRLCELLQSREIPIILQALNTIFQIVSVDDKHIQTIIEAGALQTLGVLLRHPMRHIVEGVFRIVCFAACMPTQIQAVIDNKLVNLIIDVLHQGDIKNQKDAIWAIKRITTYGSIQQTMFLVRAGVIPPVCNFLAYKDPEYIIVALDAIEDILNAAFNVGATEMVCLKIKECGGLDRIQYLLHDKDPKVHAVAVAIIDSFFSGQEENDGRY